MRFCGLIDNYEESKILLKVAISLKVQSLVAKKDTVNVIMIQSPTNLVIFFIL
jgi:hypothetical protein